MHDFFLRTDKIRVSLIQRYRINNFKAGCFTEVKTFIKISHTKVEAISITVDRGEFTHSRTRYSPNKKFYHPVRILASLKFYSVFTSQFEFCRYLSDLPSHSVIFAIPFRPISYSDPALAASSSFVSFGKLGDKAPLAD